MSCAKSSFQESEGILDFQLPYSLLLKYLDIKYIIPNVDSNFLPEHDYQIGPISNCICHKLSLLSIKLQCRTIGFRVTRLRLVGLYFVRLVYELFYVAYSVRVVYFLNLLCKVRFCTLVVYRLTKFMWRPGNTNGIIEKEIYDETKDQLRLV